MQRQPTHPRWSGRCLCGAVRFEVAGPADHVAFCHCADCRAASGAGPMPWAEFPRAGFRWTRGAPRTYASSDHGARSFCGDCGAPLTFMTTHWPDSVDVALVALDDPETLVPTYHIFWDSRPGWYEIGDDLPRFAQGSVAFEADGGAVPRHPSWEAGDGR